MDEQAVQHVRQLLEAASSAHREFELSELNGVRDVDWPAWYADYLLAHGLQKVLGREIAAEELTNLLTTSDELYRRDLIQAPWPAYYAQLILRGG